MSKRSEKNRYYPVVINRDHARPRNKPAPADAEVEARLTELISPATYALVKYYHQLGLRERILTLPVMVAMVLAMIWRQVPSVEELVKTLGRESLLWTPPVKVSQQAVDQRLRSLPEQLFGRIWEEILPQLQERTAARRRPFSPVVARALGHFGRIWVVDASTLEELFRKVGLLRQAAQAPLAGKIVALLDLPSKLPIKVWLSADPEANEKVYLDRLEALIEPGTLLLFDRGFYAFPFFDWLSDNGVRFVTRAREVAAFEVAAWLHDGANVRDRTINLGRYRSSPCAHPVRLVEVRTCGKWHRYLTNVLDPAVLPVLDVAELYADRWRIEDAFSLVKRLLGLSYLWTGAYNGIALQVWATWLLYGVLVDLSDAVAEALDVPLERISLEMVYRGLYHFTVAYQKGQASDPVAYLAAPEQSDLDIVKRHRKKRERQRRERLDSILQELNL
ncbi:MAG: IS4 family transposase [Chloroflexota bacterium]